MNAERCIWWDHNVPGRDRRCVLAAGHTGEHQFETVACIYRSGCPHGRCEDVGYCLASGGPVEAKPATPSSKQRVFKSGPIKAEFRDTCIIIEADSESGDYAEVCLDMVEARDLRNWITDLLGASETTAEPAALCTHEALKIARGYERGYDTAWCLECGGITWCSDGWVGGEDAKRNDYTVWLQTHLLAWSCRNEAEGRRTCARWCGHHKFCPASLRGAEKTSDNCEHGIPRRFCTAVHTD